MATLSTTGTLTADETVVVLNVAGMGGLGIQIQGTFSGTITFEASIQGQDYQALRMTPTNSSTAVTTATSTGIWTGSVVGMTSARARMSTYTSGIAVVELRAEPASPGGAGGGGGTWSDVNLIEVGGVGIALGQALSVASLPVVLPSDFAGMAVTVADGADVTLGDISDASVTGDNPGTVSAKLRGLSEILADVWNSASNYLRVNIENATLAVTQSGTWTVQPGNTANTTAWKVDGSAVTQPVSGTITASNTTGNVANDSADSGNPVKVGGKAASAAPTAVTAGDRVDQLSDLWGRTHTRTGAQAPVASTWTGVHVPATATQATKTQASAGSGKRNVCTGFTFTLCAGGSAPTPATPVTVKIIDGSSGGGTLLWQSNITMPAAAGGIVSINRSNLWLVGTAATAMTAEFSAAGPTNTYESVAFDGVIIEE